MHFRRDIKRDKVSAEKNEKRHRRINTTELQRVYDLTPPPDNYHPSVDSQKIVALLGPQVADLKSRLEHPQ